MEQPTDNAAVDEAKVEGAIDDWGKRMVSVLPGLMGAVDHALRDQMGSPVAFVLLTYGPGGAAYTTNISDQDKMRAALCNTVANWESAPAVQPGAEAVDMPPSTGTPQ